MSAAPKPASPIAFLRRHPDYLRYFLGMVPVQFGGQIEAVTIGWQVYHIARQTHSIEESAFLVGMVGLAQFLPLFALTLFAGTLADRPHLVRREAMVKPGTNIIEAAASVGVEIPYYCYQKRLSIAANCRPPVSPITRSIRNSSNATRPEPSAMRRSPRLI